MPELKDIIGVTPLIAFFLICAYVALKLTPMILQHRKELKLKELEVRQLEAKSQSEQAAALSQLAGTLHDIAIEQRRATDQIKILQRVNADSADQLSHNVITLSDRMQKLEGKNVESQGTGTPAH